MHPYVERFHEVFGQRLRFIRYATPAVLAFILAAAGDVALAGMAAVPQQRVVRRRATRSSMSTSASTCSSCRSSSFALDWLFAAVVIVLLLTMATHLLNGGVLFTSPTPTVRPATRVHFAVLLALLAAVKAGRLLAHAATRPPTRPGGFVQGATYTVVNAQIPALMLLMLIALLTAGPVPVDDPHALVGVCRSWRRRCGS